MDLTAGVGLAVATLGGAAIGLERQWSGHATGPPARFGGIRTLTLSLARSGASSGEVSPAAMALVAGLISNTLLKLTVAVVVGRGSFRTATAVMLGAIALAMAVSLVIL